MGRGQATPSGVIAGEAWSCRVRGCGGTRKTFVGSSCWNANYHVANSTSRESWPSCCKSFNAHCEQIRPTSSFKLVGCRLPTREHANTQHRWQQRSEQLRDVDARRLMEAFRAGPKLMATWLTEKRVTKIHSTQGFETIHATTLPPLIYWLFIYLFIESNSVEVLLDRSKEKFQWRVCISASFSNVYAFLM